MKGRKGEKRKEGRRWMREAAAAFLLLHCLPAFTHLALAVHVGHEGTGLKDGLPMI